MHRLIYFLFFLSGATALVYQVIWVRFTGLVFGNTAYSIATVLGAFMAGLALGSWRLGPVADRVTSPLRLYGILELFIGLSAALVPFLFGSMDFVYRTLSPTLSSIAGAELLVRFVASFTLMLVPTFLMGGTLPTLTRFFVANEHEVERKVGVLYGLNALGAALGSLLAALVLIPGLGSMRTSFMMAAVNVFIGLFAIGLDHGHRKALTPVEETVGSEEEQLREPGNDVLVLGTLALSGLVAMIYEVTWTRALTAMIGSSTYAFSIMLVTFLVGIGSGSWIIGRWRPPASLGLLGLMQLGIAVGGLVFLIGYLAAPYILLGLIRASFYSFPAVLTTQFVMCFLLMVLATLFMGASFPIAGQLYARRVRIIGRRIGSVYSVNTVGAILGSLLAGFVLIPIIGTERAILAGLFLNAAMALILLTREKVRPYSFCRWVALGLLLVAAVSMRGGFFWDPNLMDRGILIYAKQLDARPELKISEHYQTTDMVYFAEGHNATISVRRGENYTGLRINGKVDASTGDDMRAQLLMAYLPGFHHHSPESALVIGYGAGVSAGAIAALPEVQRVDCVEIEPAVISAAPWFAEVNRKSYEDPKIRIIYNDGRNYLNTTRHRYDVIISAPSNPWIAGIGNLFTSEFYQRASEVLNPDGVFAQWIQVYKMDPEDLRMILAEFQRQFPEVSVWNAGTGDLILIGTRQPQNLDLSRVERIVAENETIRRDFRVHLGMTDATGIMAYYVISSPQVRDFAATHQRNTDDHPVLEFHAPRNLFMETRDLNLKLLYERKTGLFPPGATIPDPARAYIAVVPPLLGMNRSNLVNRAMTLLVKAGWNQETVLYLVIARLNLDSGALESAKNALTRVDELSGEEDPHLGEREELWGMLKEKMGATREAIQRFRRVVAMDPSRDYSLLRLARLNAELKLWKDAMAWMERYITTKPVPIALYWALLGEYRLAAGQMEPGLEALETALRHDPYSFQAHNRLADLFIQQKAYDRAIEHLELLTKYAFDRDPNLYIKLADLYTSSGRMSDARRLLRKGARIFPADLNIHRLYRRVRSGERE